MAGKNNQKVHHKSEPSDPDNLRSALNTGNRFDSLLVLIGSGRDLWADEHVDDYVNRLREGWE
ncbi:MAG TPA: hypothetical protein VME86_07280 [Acidobacteriaceae bacterium]|nr:hypothetical protein [Acidobacteriaceae bacterium]